MIKTEVISARVSTEVAKMIRTAAKNNGMATNKYVAEKLSNQVMSTGGTIHIPEIKYELPEDVKGILSVVGGAGVGFIVYNLLKNHLPTESMDQETRDAVALFGAIGAGLVGLMSIESLLQKKE